MGFRAYLGLEFRPFRAQRENGHKGFSVGLNKARMYLYECMDTRDYGFDGLCTGHITRSPKGANLFVSPSSAVPVLKALGVRMRISGSGT